MSWDTGYRSENVSLSVCTVICLIIMLLVQSQCMCVFSRREQWIHSVHCGTALLCKWNSVFEISVCKWYVCSDLWKWDFNTITSWAIINSLLKYWALYPWKLVSAAIRVKQWLTLAVIEFWSCYSRRIHLIGNILNTCSAVRLLLSFHSKVNMK